MSITETSYRDFVVWSETIDFHCERLLPDTDFISEQRNLAKKVFHLAILQELHGKWFTRDHIA